MPYEHHPALVPGYTVAAVGHWSDLHLKAPSQPAGGLRRSVRVGSRGRNRLDEVGGGAFGGGTHASRVSLVSVAHERLPSVAFAGHTGRVTEARTGEVLLTTPRLLLRSWRPDDLPTFAELNADPEVMRYLGHALTASEATEFADAIQERFLQRGFGLRLGMSFDHEADLVDEHDGEKFQAVVHSITAQQWGQRQNPQ